MRFLKIFFLCLALFLLALGAFTKGKEFVKLRASFLCTACTGLGK